MEFRTEAVERRLELMNHWIIENEDTGDVIGIKPGAPAEMQAEYEAYLAELDAAEPVVR